MNLDVFDKIALLFFVLLLIFTVAKAYSGTWNEKPVMCEQKEIALDTLKKKGEIPIITGTQSTKVFSQDGLAIMPVHIPLQIFVNFKTKTFSIIEFHPVYNSVCVIAYGDDYKAIGLSN